MDEYVLVLYVKTGSTSDSGYVEGPSVEVRREYFTHGPYAKLRKKAVGLARRMNLREGYGSKFGAPGPKGNCKYFCQLGELDTQTGEWVFPRY